MFSRADLRPCRRCTKTVRWTTSEAGKPFAVDPDPSDKGNTAVWRDVAGTLRSRRPNKDEPIRPHERLMMPHVATCKPEPKAKPKPPPKPPRPERPATAGLYELLDVPRTAVAADITRAYRRLARALHPDVNPDPAARERFKDITRAYTVLSDPAARTVYDQTGRPPRAR